MPKKRRIIRNPKNRSRINARWVGQTINFFRHMDLSKLKSRKLWLTIFFNALGTVLMAVGMDQELVMKLLAAVNSSYLVGQGIADTKKGDK